MISLKRLQQLIQTMIGQVIAEAAILKYVIQLYQVLEEWEQLSINQLLQMPIMHVDETSLWVGQKNQWELTFIVDSKCYYLRNTHMCHLRIIGQKEH